MKQVKKLLVVLPLVLVFVLGSLPVMADWPRDADTTANISEIKIAGDVEVTYLDEGVATQEVTLTAANFKRGDVLDGLGIVNPQKVLDKIVGLSSFAKGYKDGKLVPKAGVTAELSKLITALETPDTTPSRFKIELEEKEEEKPQLLKIGAVDRLTLKRIRTEIHELENKLNAKSVYDMAWEFFNWETEVSGTLQDYYFLGFAPDVNNARTDLEEDVMKDHKLDILVWVVRKLQPLSVTHVFPDRAPLWEEIMVDYWVLEKGQINNANAAEFAKTRIQKMNEQGYVYEKAEYTPYIYRESIMKDALDVYGKKIKVDAVVSHHGIFVYYKGAVIPAPVPEAEKKVDAATAQTGVQANVQAPVAAAGAQPQQLPATGVADNAFLFLSSAALMALGIFFFKKH